jgi:hypothetical protein
MQETVTLGGSSYFKDKLKIISRLILDKTMGI